MQISQVRGITLTLTLICQLCFFSSCRQEGSNAAQVKITDSLKSGKANKYAPIDQSPLDISYCPPDFPQKKMTNTAGSASPVARVIYSRPHKKNRKIFGTDSSSICPYGQPWRLGANESTEIEFFKPAVINGTNVKAGRYVMYCIPYADKWVIVFNNNLDSWGLNVDPSKDIFKVEVPVQQQPEPVEDFTISFLETPTGADLMMTWDTVKIFLPITYTK
jgi:hypothetical protein